MNDRDVVDRYHDGTKHRFDRFARSLGYLDWASQPTPFRAYAGAPEISLRSEATGVADLLRHSLGLSAWKRFNATRWSLRVNPSSGNLHPTEAYVVGPDGVFHYAPDRHALEHRCRCQPALGDGRCLIALTSIHWREAWKYGERAFRYCQHDLGHAIAAIAIAAANAGMSARVLSDWSHADVAALTGVDRDEDFVGAEREEAGCVLAVGSHQSSGGSHQSSGGSLQSAVARFSRQSVLDAVRGGAWMGCASRLSEDHVEWPIIDEVARATRTRGDAGVLRSGAPLVGAATRYPRALILQRRSAVDLDGHSSIDRERFLDILAQTMPSDAPPWNALAWDARIHLALFVHRVDGLDPGLYLLVRNVDAIDRLRAAIRRDFAWMPVTTDVPLFCLANGDARALARRLSCDQDIAANGFFSLGMIADFDASLDEFGAAFYRSLFWESGVVGQVLYLEAERAGARGTGIGCFYDDPVHDALGLTGHVFQSLYHFTIGIPVEDARLTTERGYEWEPSTSTGAP